MTVERWNDGMLDELASSVTELRESTTELRESVSEVKDGIDGLRITAQALLQLAARMLTINHSLKLQGRSVLDFLTQSCLAARLGIQHPSLIPTVQQTPLQNPRPLIFL
jgi:hypothetical protein